MPITADTTRLNKLIKDAVLRAIAEYHNLPISAVKVENVVSEAEELNPPGFHYNIRVGAQAILGSETKTPAI